MTPPHILALGDVTRDILGLLSPTACRPDLHLLDAVDDAIGGKAVNTARLLAAAGFDTSLLATVGADIQPLDRSLPDVDVRHVVTDPAGRCGTYIAVHGQDGGRAFYRPGYETGRDRLLAAPLLAAVGGVPCTDLYVAVNHPAFARDALARGRARGARTILSAHSAVYAPQPGDLAACLDHSSWVVGNVAEVDALLDRLGLARADLFARFPVELLVETAAADGARLTTKQQTVEVRPPAAVVREPTGAGDAFLAGLITGVIRTGDLTTAARWGAVLAAFAVEWCGPLPALPSWNALERRYHATYGCGPPEPLRSTAATAATHAE